jgi:NADPH-dependent ferric siderophore reductase
MPEHEIIRMRRDSTRRTLLVAEKRSITPRMLRIIFRSDELQGFDSPSPDDHIKVFFPPNGDQTPAAARDFTPRAWDVKAGTFTIDFALHDTGPAVDWARQAQVGDSLQIGGPRGSTVVPDDFDWYLLLGDATALPSFGRRLEQIRTGVPVALFALIADSAEQQGFATAADCTVHWLTCGLGPHECSATVLAALEQFPLPPGDGFVWIAAEASVSRDLYSYLVEKRGHPTQWIKAAAYWTASVVE